MTGRRPQHLERRHGVYYFRAYIPAALQPVVGRAELRHSLRTRNPTYARSAALAGAYEFAKLCERLRGMTDPTDIVIRAAVRAFAERLLAKAEPPPSFDGLTQETDKDFTRDMVEENIIDLREAVKADIYDDKIDDRLRNAANIIAGPAANLARENGFRLEELAEGPRLMLLQGVARALIEDRNQYLHRLDDRLTPYLAKDPLFADATVTDRSRSPSGSMAFEDAVSAYIQTKANIVWTKRTEEENRRILRLATEHFGATTPIATISRDQLRGFRDQLLTWRRKPPSSAPLATLVGAKAPAHISAITAAKYFGYLTAAFRHWADEGLLEHSPVGRLSVKVPKGKKSGARMPFGDSDLQTLFSSPMYVGCQGPFRRMTPGAEIIKDGYYWIPLVGALSGMRVSEIVQLALEDADLTGDVPALTVKGDVALGQSVKSDAGWRRVPIHRRLLSLGFDKFIEARCKSPSSARIFADVKISKTGGSGGEFSRWFGRRLGDIGLAQPELVFHSFRHRFIDELREAGTPPYVIKAIIGHEGGDTTDRYGTKARALSAKSES